MKKKLAKPLSLLLAAAMVAGVAQTGFPRVYAAEGEVGGEGASVRPSEDWDGPAGSLGELTASEEQEFVFPFVTTGSAVLAELELDIYLNDDAKEIPDGKDDKDGLLGKDYEKAVKFNLPSFDKDQSFTETQIKELITHWLGKMKNDDSRANTITFLKAAGVTFSGDKGEEKVSSAAGADISYEGDKTNGTWSFTLDTTQLEKIEFLVEAHTDDEDISWGNNNYTLLDGTKAYLYTIEKGDTEEEVGNADDLKSALEDGNYDTNTKQVHYYLNEANTKAPQKVTDANELNAALINPEIAVIQLGNDISLSGGAYLDIARPVVLDGQNHALKFSGLEALDAADHNDDAVIIRAAAEGTKIQDLTVDAGLKTPKTWVGTYAIHAYNTREVTLYNVKATGANGGILVNSSDVTLKGEIDVSGNGFGGIEISKANESAKDSYLNAEEDTSFVNGTEAYGIPTLWVDGTADEEDAGKWLAVEENTFTAVSISSDSKQQVHYYLDPAHSEPIQSPKITIESIPEGIVATESKIAETETGKINVFSNNGRTPVQVSLTKGSENYSHVRVVVSLEKDGSRTTDGIQLIAQDTNHVWWNIVKSGWGPSAGFELPDKKTTTDVYLVAYQPGKYTANIQLIDVSNGNVLAEQSATITAASFHTVTLAGGGTDSSGGGSYAATTTVSINAGTRSGYSFNGWTASPAITFANAASAVTTFIMPDTNVTVTANWRSNSSSRDDDDSSSGGSSSKPSTGNQDTTGTVSTNPAPGGGTVTTVTTQPSSTVVTGGAAQITAAVPDSAAAAIASATPQSPAQVNISVPTAAVTQQLQNAEVTRASLTITVPPAVANNTNASAQVVVNADAGLLNAARVARKDLEITIQNAQTGRTVYAWSFNGAALAQATEIRSLNLALSVQPTSSVPAVQSAAPSSAGIVLRFANNGQLPAPATVTVDVSSQGYQPGQVLYFYYLNPNTGRLEAMNNAQPITVNAQGYAAVTVTHNSDFVLLPKKLATGSLTLDTVSYTLPKGKAYEIGAKLAGEGATLKVAPSRSGIVKIENTKSGNYKVTGLKDGITYVSFDVYSGGKLVSHSSVKITVQSSGKAQGVAGRRVMNF